MRIDFKDRPTTLETVHELLSLRVRIDALYCFLHLLLSLLLQDLRRGGALATDDGSAKSRAGSAR
jgi:hypothetical protein